MKKQLLLIGKSLLHYLVNESTKHRNRYNYYRPKTFLKTLEILIIYNQNDTPYPKNSTKNKTSKNQVVSIFVFISLQCNSKNQDQVTDQSKNKSWFKIVAHCNYLPLKNIRILCQAGCFFLNFLAGYFLNMWCFPCFTSDYINCIFIWFDSLPECKRIYLCKLCPEIKYQGRIIDPGNKYNNRCSCSIC